MSILRKAADGATEGNADYWYGVIEPYGGTLVPELHYHQFGAREAAHKWEGTVVLVAVRILEDEDGEYWPLPSYSKKEDEDAAKLAESEVAVAESKQRFEEAMAREVAKGQ